MAPGVRAVFLDRDGVVNRNRDDYIRVEEHFVYLENTAEAFGLLGALGLPLVVVTNQSAIARGYTIEATVLAIHDRLRRDAESWGGAIAAIEYCPHGPAQNCRCRKPGPGMFEKAALELGLELRGSYMIGDSPSDIEAGARLGMTTIRVDSGRDEEGGPDPDARVADLLEAARLITEREEIS